MAKTITIPTVTLTDEQRKMLQEVQEPLALANRQVALLERIGIDMSDVKAKLTQAQAISKGLLDEF